MLALLGLATLLPIAIVLVVSTSLLFSGLNDAGAARVLNGVALALGLLWLLGLVSLTIALALDALGRRDAGHEERIRDEEGIGDDGGQ
ncbi:MAG TPA: hypothetical protein VG826_05830 [Pirellulales bacterium]|nr:hypothetical protein [Pirellulales bacterium]